MQATDILMEEHQVVVRVLASLETAAVRLQRGENVRPGFFVDAADFVKGFADGCHHKKEENVLFKAIVDAGPQGQGPVAVMLSEHDQGRAFTRGMREAAQRIEAGDAGARKDVVGNALGYVELLRQHIDKENDILFPLAAEVIPMSEQAKLVDRFETIEHEETGEGVHEKYLALANALGKEAATE